MARGHVRLSPDRYKMIKEGGVESEE